MTEQETMKGLRLTARLAAVLWGLPVRFLDRGFGLAPYIVDDQATRTGPNSTSTRLLGADWLNARDESGAVVEVYARLAPGLATSWAGFGELVEAMEKRGWCDVRFRKGAGGLGYDAAWWHVNGQAVAATGDDRLQAGANAAYYALTTGPGLVKEDTHEQ